MSSNTIKVKCVGRHEEAFASGICKPGHLLALDADLKVLKNSNRGGFAELLIAKEDALQGKTIDDAYAVADVVSYLVAARGDVFQGRLAAGAVAVVQGTSLLQSAGDGTFEKVLSGGTILNSVVASTAVSNTVNTEQDFSVTGSVPAYYPRAGTVLNIRGHVVVSATAGTDTSTVKVYLGSQVIATSPAVDNATGDVIRWDLWVTYRTVGASGTYVVSGTISNGVPGTATERAVFLASTAIDTTAATTVKASITYSATTATCTAAVQSFVINALNATPGVPLTVAMESVDNSLEAAEAFCKMRAL